jgi:hypothetical protein
MSKLARESCDKIQFLVIHLFAIGGNTGGQEFGVLYVDDVILEMIN